MFLYQVSRLDLNNDRHPLFTFDNSQLLANAIQRRNGRGQHRVRTRKREYYTIRHNDFHPPPVSLQNHPPLPSSFPLT